MYEYGLPYSLEPPYLPGFPLPLWVPLIPLGLLLALKKVKFFIYGAILLKFKTQHFRLAVFRLYVGVCVLVYTDQLNAPIKCSN